MKKICTLLLVLGGLAVIPSCVNDDCKVGPNLQYFDVMGFSVSSVQQSDTLPHFQTYFDLTDTTALVPATDFGFRLIADMSYYAADLAPARMGLFGSAYACSPTPSPGNRGSQEVIESITITSNAAFGPSFPAGASLNELFEISSRYTYPNYTDSLTTNTIPLPVFLAHNPKPRPEFYFWLKERPETALSHRFTVIYKQTNGEEYVVTAPLVTFE